MPKSYLRYAQERSVGLLATHGGNIVASPHTKLMCSPCLEDVGVWDLRTGQLIQLLHNDEDHGEVTCLALHPTRHSLVAVGHMDGRIHVWDYVAKTRLVVFNGHKTAVTALAFNADGTQLASGARDTDIVVWDVISESGLYRLRGHRDQITDLKFVRDSCMLISSSKDTYIKVWDLVTQHCIQTCVEHRAEVWGFDVSPDGSRMVTGASDNMLRLWRLRESPVAVPSAVPAATSDVPTNGSGLIEVTGGTEEAAALHDVAQVTPVSTVTEESVLEYVGSVPRLRNERAGHVRFSDDGGYIACLAAGKGCEVFRVRSPEEVKKKVHRRKKRLREKGKEKEAVDGDADAQDEPLAQDELELWGYILAEHKLRSLAFLPTPSDGVSIMVAYQNNQMVEYRLTPGEAEVGHAVVAVTRTLAHEGHRSDVRNICVSSDGESLLTVSAGLAKLWNAKTMSCVRSMECGFALCCGFGPGNRHGLIGTKAGAIQVFDLASGDLVEEVTDAHEGAIWGIAVRPDDRGFVTGGADKQVKFWDFELKTAASDGSGAKQLTVVHTRALLMTSEVQCIAYSHHTDAAKLLVAVGLLDNTIKVYFEDSLKFFLSLYGHKLPVLSLAISTDNTLLISGSADKNVKIWGLDFGDCHRSLFAHSEAVTALAFVPKTHLFFSAGRDRAIKYWDGDRFEHVFTLEGHKAEVLSIALSPKGTTLYSTSADRSVREWARTDEIVLLEEEQEKRLEAALDKGIDEEETAAAATESGVAGKKTGDSVRAADRLADALEVVREEMAKWTEYAQDRDSAHKDYQRNIAAGLKVKAPPGLTPPTRNPVLLNATPSQYLLRILREIRPADLDQALICLTFNDAVTLLSHLHHTLRKGIATELACKCVLFLTKLHHKQIIATGVLATSFPSLQAFVHLRLQEHKDRVGVNLAALRYHERRMADDASRLPSETMPAVTPKPIRVGKRKALAML